MGETLVTCSRQHESRFLCRLEHLDEADQAMMTIDWDHPYPESYCFFQAMEDTFRDPSDNEVHWMHPFNLQARAISFDDPKIWDLPKLNQEEQATWLDAMDLEFNSLFEKKTFRLINRDEIPRDADGTRPPIERSTWILKTKRRPDGSFVKRKARLCLRGDLQAVEEDPRDDAAWAPTVNWGAARLLFILTVAQGLCSTQIDFRNAFVQSSLPTPICMEFPPGCSSADGDKVFEVNKSLYGDRRAPRLFYLCLRNKLESPKLGFHASEKDPCLFLRDGCAIIFWVDDAVIFAKDQSTIDSVIADMRACDLDLDIEDDYAGYLGIHVNKNPDGTMH